MTKRIDWEAEPAGQSDWPIVIAFMFGLLWGWLATSVALYVAGG